MSSSSSELIHQRPTSGPGMMLIGSQALSHLIFTLIEGSYNHYSISKIKKKTTEVYIPSSQSPGLDMQLYHLYDSR